MPTAATIAIAQDNVTARLEKAIRKLAKKHELDVAELPYERNADLARIAELERIADVLDGVIKAEKREEDDAPAPEPTDDGYEVIKAREEADANAKADEAAADANGEQETPAPARRRNSGAK